MAMHQAIAPQHQARHDFDIFADLADRLGYRETFTEGRDEMAWIRHIYQECGAAQRSHDVEWPDFETFGNKGMSVYLLPPKHLCSLILSVKTHRLIHYRPRVAKLNYLVKKIASYQYNDFAPHAEWKPPVEWLGAPLAEQWPLHLISIQPGDRLHSQLDPAPLAQSNKTAGRETLYMHPLDAASRDITEGSQVQVSNLRGHCLAGSVLLMGLPVGWY